MLKLKKDTTSLIQIKAAKVASKCVGRYIMMKIIIYLA